MTFALNYELQGELASSGSSSDRRAQRTHPAKKHPELLATRPNEIWNWDIAKLHGPTRGLFYDLHVILDIFSRYVLNGLVAANEGAELVKEFIEDAILTQGIIRGMFTIHANREGPCAQNR
jgi:putative transposase